MPSQSIPPQAPRRAKVLEAHGDRRVDDWYWLAERENPEVVSYLEAENSYTSAMLAPANELVERLFEKIKARVVETDCNAPSRRGEWWYWSRTEEGQQYAKYCRRRDSERALSATQVLADARANLAGAGEQVILDENLLAAGSDYFSLGVFDISTDQRRLAYAIDTDGSERYQLRIRDLETSTDLADLVEGVYYGSAWSADGESLFYIRPDEAMRPYQVWRHDVGTEATSDSLVYTEADERFFVSVERTRSERFVLIHSESKMTSEARYLDAAEPKAEPMVVLPREQGVEYDLDHAVWGDGSDQWVLRTNRALDDGSPATDFALYRLAVGTDSNRAADSMVEVLGHRPGTKLESVEAFSRHLVVSERSLGLGQLRVLSLAGPGREIRPEVPTPAGGVGGGGVGVGDEGGGVGGGGVGVGDEESEQLVLGAGIGASHLVAQPDPVFTLTPGANPEWDSTVYRFGYSSLVMPTSSIDYEIEARRREVVRVQPVRGYDPSQYRSERLWASAPDGARIPISLVARKEQSPDGTAPCLLYGYGAYEINVDPVFSPARVNLLECGVVFAVAHVRGGGEMGRSWYEGGRLANKPNTFGDFIACAEHLIATGWASAGRLAIRGGSAGGLLMGAVTNLRPDLWRAVVAEVPFVDVLTTMSDVSLPLTVTEWEEWGDPLHDPEAYRLIKSYSPYDNATATDYPAMYVTAGLNDPRVGYWEPAKWVAKIRAIGTGKRPVLLRTELGAGHQGLSGRYDAWRDEARIQAFLLKELGVEACQ